MFRCQCFRDNEVIYPEMLLGKVPRWASSPRNREPYRASLVRGICAVSQGPALGFILCHCCLGILCCYWIRCFAFLFFTLTNYAAHSGILWVCVWVWKCSLSGTDERTEEQHLNTNWLRFKLLQFKLHVWYENDNLTDLNLLAIPSIFYVATFSFLFSLYLKRREDNPEGVLYRGFT
jgi:hypothetical protein